MRTLSRKELTAALAARQMLLERRRMSVAEALRLLTPLQAQEPQAPFIALAARLEDFRREDLEAAIEAGDAVKSTLMRITLHMAPGDEFAAYAQVVRQSRMRGYRNRLPQLFEPDVEPGLIEWFAEPRSNEEIRAQIRAIEGVPQDDWTSITFARTLLPLIQIPPAGFWADRRRPRFTLHPSPWPDPADAATLVLERYLAAFGPASRRDLASWSGSPQRDFTEAFERLPLVTFRDEKDVELFDLPGQPLPPATTKLPVRFLGRWEQPLLAYEDRDRIMTPEVQALKLTLSGDQTVLVDGRVAASWKLEGSGKRVRVAIAPHVAIPKRAHGAIRREAKRTAKFCRPEATAIEVFGL